MSKYAPVTSPYLDDNSTSVWYMLADPMDTASFGRAFLNGMETPTVEKVPLSGEYLGQLFRAYFDFGFCQIDPQGSVKMA